MLTNSAYIGLMKSICKNHKSLGERANAVIVNGAAPDPTLYLQHLLNAMKTFSGFFMIIQSMDAGYPQTADHVTKEGRVAFLILKSFGGQNATDHINTITDCELIAEEVLGMLNKYFKKVVLGKRDFSFSLNDVNLESVSIIGENKCGVRVDFIIRASNSQMLTIDEDNWVNIADIGFPA
jgi:hypothetical protein